MGIAGRLNKAKKDDGSQYLALGISIGLALGAAIGAALQNVALGVSFGMAFGVAVGCSLMAMKTKRASGKTRTNLIGPNS